MAVREVPEAGGLYLTMVLASDRDAVWRAAREIMLEKEKHDSTGYHSMWCPSTSELVQATGLKRGRLMRILKVLLAARRMRRWESSGKYFWEAGYPIRHGFYGWSMLRMETVAESDCAKCIHRKVCDWNMEKRCSNYECGDSRGRGCDGCVHRFTRFDKDEKIPCFDCEDEWWGEGEIKCSGPLGPHGKEVD